MNFYRNMVLELLPVFLWIRPPGTSSPLPFCPCCQLGENRAAHAALLSLAPAALTWTAVLGPWSCCRWLGRLLPSRCCPFQELSRPMLSLGKLLAERCMLLLSLEKLPCGDGDELLSSSSSFFIPCCCPAFVSCCPELASCRPTFASFERGDTQGETRGRGAAHQLCKLLFSSFGAAVQQLLLQVWCLTCLAFNKNLHHLMLSTKSYNNDFNFQRPAHHLKLLATS